MKRTVSISGGRNITRNCLPLRWAAYLNRGIFEDKRHLQSDLLAADFDPEAATRLGAPEGALLLDTRARELLNWLDHVDAKRTA